MYLGMRITSKRSNQLAQIRWVRAAESSIGGPSSALRRSLESSFRLWDMTRLSLDLSIVVPTVNRPALVARAVRSCFAGSVRPQQVLVVHDAPSHVERYARVYDELSTLPIRRLVHSQQVQLQWVLI